MANFVDYNIFMICFSAITSCRVRTNSQRGEFSAQRFGGGFSPVPETGDNVDMKFRVRTSCAAQMVRNTVLEMQTITSKEDTEIASQCVIDIHLRDSKRVNCAWPRIP
jgi:hypothetical protein